MKTGTKTVILRSVRTSEEHLNELVVKYARRDLTLLGRTMTVREALDAIRARGVGEQIVYFYVADENGVLVGVVPTRQLLMADLDRRLSDVMVEKVVSIPHSATVFDACEFFVMHKYLAFPVVDEEKRILGVVDINLFAEEIFDIAERDKMDSFFESLGFRLSSVRDARPLKAFRFRFPWLLATIFSGTACAVLASLFADTLAQTIVLAFFLTLVLGLGESVSMQSMTLAIHVLHTMKPTLRWYLSALRREAATAVLLGAASGTLVGLIVWLWQGDPLAGMAIGTSIALSILSACVLGLSIPAFLHSLKLDPKIAAGPITLALADLATVTFYLSVATIVL
ncbi:MAG TPA: magnesium transporter [Sedimentisphaerales bacterium]|nr:magnesium transporter [Sedimentisphaerales bacterium]